MALKPVAATDPVSADAVKVLNPAAPVASLAARVDSVAAPAAATSAESPDRVKKEQFKQKTIELTGHLTRSQARVAELERQLASIGATTLLQHLDKVEERQKRAKDTIDASIAALSSTAIELNTLDPALAVTRSMDAYNASFKGFTEEIEGLATRVSKIKEAQKEIGVKEIELEKGAKVEGFIAQAKALLKAETKDEAWRNEVKKLKELLSQFRTDGVIPFFISESNPLAKNLMKPWNEALYAYFQVEMIAEKQEGERLLATSSALKQDIRLYTQTALKAIEELQKKPFDLQAYVDFLDGQFELVVKVAARKEIYKSTLKEFEGIVTTVNEDLYYFKKSEKFKLYHSSAEEVQEAHLASLTEHKKALDQSKALLEKEVKEITALLETFGSTLDRVYEAANNNGAPLSSASWLTSGSNTCKNACAHANKYIQQLQPLIDALRAKLPKKETTTDTTAAPVTQ